MLKGKYYLGLIVAFFAINSASATVWRVNNNPGIDADVKTNIQDAHDGAVAGDTLYVEGSGTNYGNLTITKQLYIYGPGYEFSNNPSQAIKQTAYITYMTANSGSEGSMFTGLVFGYTTLNVGNMFFKRNWFESSSDLIHVTPTASNVLIAQNYMKQTSTSSSYQCVHVRSGANNVIVSNNYMEKPSTSTDALYVENGGYATIYNNVISGGITLNGSNFYNNVVLDGNLTLNGCASKYNLSNSTQLDTSNTSNNQININMNSVFDGTGSSDAKWKLASSSPASGAGMEGEDCGMFGGIEPYVLSGIPAIPSIYFYKAPNVGTNTSGLNIKLKAKSNK